MVDVSDLLNQLLNARQLEAALDVVQELEEVHGFSWHAVGNRENNYGQINIGSDPGFALVERVTNAIDAVIEQASEAELLASGKRGAPTNPREAVERWFSIEAGRIRNLEQDERQVLAEKVTVALLTGSRGRSYPTILVRDLGIGMTPELVPRSILGLGEGNKIDKSFLAGAYGQGGSTTFAFSPGGTLIATQERPAATQRSGRPRLRNPGPVSRPGPDC